MQSAAQKLISKIKTTALKQVVYVDNAHYHFQVNDSVHADDAGFSLVTATSKAGEHQQRSETEQVSKAKVAILSRNCYREKIEWYPITKKIDLLKLVKLQVENAPAKVLFIIGKSQNGKTPVTYYQLNQLCDGIKSWLLLPETYLIAQQSGTETLWSYQTPFAQNTVFVAKGLATPVSAIKGGMIQTVQQFALSQGLAAEQVLSLSAEQHATALYQQLSKLYQMPFIGLINKANFKAQNNSARLKKFVLPSLVVVSGYLLLAVQISAYEAQSAKQALQLATKEANVVLNQYKDINQMIERYQQLEGNTPQSTELLAVWQVLAPMYDQGVIFNDVQQTQNQVTIRISAESASQTLQMLLGQPGVGSAEFIGSVRRQRGLDAATIQFAISPLVLTDNNIDIAQTPANANKEVL
ncbi:hypothetical protein [Shewanella sairae]|nr:hypothetical protein [Shewanella sairae]MCL1131407.1 hypothetical protein [Shewanella sairae]